jgi:hypothetical protein
MQMTDRVVEILRTKYFTSPIHYEGMQRIETLEVPEDALREILYNTICHNDYTGVHIQMRVWDDYCEVWNEGELPMGYTPETLLNQHSSNLGIRISPMRSLRLDLLNLGDVVTRKSVMVLRVQAYLCRRLILLMVELR